MLLWKWTNKQYFFTTNPFKVIGRTQYDNYH